MTTAIGRPRADPTRAGASAREDILAAAAEHFATGGFAGTSTRQIAEAAGLRQATIYYHFGGKEEILLELLLRSVSPTLERARGVVGGGDPRAALEQLVRADVDTLLADPHNIGILYLSPEVAGESFDAFRGAREALVDIYCDLIARVCPDRAELRARLCIHQVESVIGLRRAGVTLDGVAEEIVRACLRIADV